MFVLCSNWGIQVGNPIIPLWKKLKFITHPSLKWLTFAQHKHEPKVKAVMVTIYFFQFGYDWQKY